MNARKDPVIVMTRQAIEAFSVSEVMRYLHAIMDADDDLQDLWVRGEVSNLSLPASGHCYFSLKDEGAAMRCVAFRGAVSSMPRLAPGMQVFVHGRVAVYESRGDLQLYVDAVEDMGIGVLFQRFMALREELDAQGLFAVERKRPIPTMPLTIGIVTSASGAALRDIIRTLRLRWPIARAILAPTLVQGDGAAEQIARGIDALNQQGAADVIIVARGGGSVEDLWAFNERPVALAIANSHIPIVTGIGHETDFTIADFAADLRTATPTAAAAAVSPDIMTFRVAVSGSIERLQVLMQEQVRQRYDDVAEQLHHLQRAHPRARADRARQMVDDLTATMHELLAHRLVLERERLSGAVLRLQSLSPLLTIARGFSRSHPRSGWYGDQEHRRCDAS